MTKIPMASVWSVLGRSDPFVQRNLVMMVFCRAIWRECLFEGSFEVFLSTSDKSLPGVLAIGLPQVSLGQAACATSVRQSLGADNDHRQASTTRRATRNSSTMRRGSWSVDPGSSQTPRLRELGVRSTDEAWLTERGVWVFRSLLICQNDLITAGACCTGDG